VSAGDLVACVDVGSTFTKAAVVDIQRGRLSGTASHRTTSEGEVLDGLDAAVAAAVTTAGGVTPGQVRACSSAGGGLRLAVVGYEALVTARAGHMVGLSAGARVVRVAAGRLDKAQVADLVAHRPDVVLLVGGTDGGEADTIRHNAAALSGLRIPVVLAGNVEVRDEITALLTVAGVPVLPTDNVLPRIGELNPGPARQAIRELFLRHVIGGKGLSRQPRFAALVRGATPDLVLAAVEVLADGAGDVPGYGDVLVVDVGGATTDVYSALTPDPHQGGPDREVAGTLWRGRTVEGDLGVRISAPGIVAAALAERLIDDAEAEQLAKAADRRAEDPAFVADDATETAIDARLTRLAITVALRRHARGERVGPQPAPRRGGRDLRQVRLVVGSGGVLRRLAPAQARALLREAVDDPAGGWPLPRDAVYAIDTRYALAAAGLLAVDHPAVAARLLRHEITVP